MRHNVQKHKKFNNKDNNHRDAMLRNLAGSLILHGRIETTEKRAKALIPVIDRLIGHAKDPNTTYAIRKVRSVLFTDVSSKKLFELTQRYADRKSGFTRIVPVRFRDGDSAKMVMIEFIS